MAKEKAKEKSKRVGKHVERSLNGEMTSSVRQCWTWPFWANIKTNKISWEALEQGSSGICILSCAVVNEKREFIFSRNFSASPSIILTIGQIDPPVGKEPRCTFLTIPGWLSDKPVALNCTLIQVGDQPFEVPEVKEITTSIQVHIVCMIQVFREEAEPTLFCALQDG